MIVGIGTDLVALDRISRILNRHKSKFLQRILAPCEMPHLPASALAAYVAGRFAAKEAAVKALGCGFVNGVSFLDVIVLNNPAGQPHLSLAGRARSRALDLGVRASHISITHERSMALAVVVLET